MNTLVSKIGTISVVLLLCLLNSINVYADKDEDILLEGRLSPYDLRSAPATDPIKAILSNENLCLTFYRACSSIEIIVKEAATNTIIYSEIYTRPQYVNIPLRNQEEGAYIIELRTKNGYMYGTFLLIN